jgi:4-amino-4-deoxychorismate lyase
VILVDGIPAGTVSVADRGLNYGDGLFETMRLHDGRVPLLARHLARLREGCRSLGIPWPDAEVIAADVQRVGAVGGEGIIKVILTRGDGGRGYAPPSSALGRRIVGSYPLPAIPAAPVEVGVCDTPIARNPRLAGIKHLSRIEQVLAADEVVAAGWFDGLMLDETGVVAEATRHNLFLVREGRLHTPVLADCGVSGIMRGLVLEAAAASGVAARETVLRSGDLAGAEEAFLTNAVRGLVPVRRLAGKVLAEPVMPGRLAPALRAAGVTWLDV